MSYCQCHDDNVCVWARGGGGVGGREARHRRAVVSAAFPIIEMVLGVYWLGGGALRSWHGVAVPCQPTHNKVPRLGMWAHLHAYEF